MSGQSFLRFSSSQSSLAVKMLLGEIWRFERSLHFLPLLLNAFSSIRLFARRVLMIVVFLQSIRNFISAESNADLQENGFVAAFLDIFVAITLTLAIITLVDFVISKIRNQIQKVNETSLDVYPFPSQRFGRKKYNNFFRLLFSILITTSTILLFDCHFALPFFFAALVFVFVANSVMKSINHIRILRVEYFRNNALEFITLASYLLSICIYAYFFSMPQVGLIGFFIIILVPRVSFAFARKLVV